MKEAEQLLRLFFAAYWISAVYGSGRAADSSCSALDTALRRASSKSPRDRARYSMAAF